ncbi:MAG: TlpA family protein disulfide reductase [Emcibacter sp.]|nr:TlpA family protein disulfide reductase [Emcibacter sp.]
MMHKNLILVVAFVSALLGAIYIIGPTDTGLDAKKDEFFPLDSGLKNGTALFNIYGVQTELPITEITDEAGKIMTLNDLKGQNLLINFWATWCVPCREEMPELDALQAARGNDDFKVIAISVDRGGLESSRAFLDEIGVQHLDLYYDEKGTLARKMKTIGYPTTILITKAGKQFGILTGPAHWNSAKAHALIDRLITDKSK